eukprot:TRINITY_DN3075_c0_g1_i2.p1 TRINITY_DN3075_c0_g1~~TRINITY_DN3075_c0_g1_i2.p1  ORF type:complete len:142 (-),score=21.59 TRINITY_DN3075_c0_g1_i2:192-617(-)
MARRNRIVPPKPEDYANLREENHTTYIYVKGSQFSLATMIFYLLLLSTDYLDGADAKEHRQKAFWYGPTTTVVEFKNSVLEAYESNVDPSEILLVWIGRTLADKNEDGELETMANAMDYGPRGGYPPIFVIKVIKKEKGKK